MCVAVPGKVISIGEESTASLPAIVDFGDRTLEINLVMVPDIQPGEWVVAHSGYAIRQVHDPSSDPESHEG